MNVGDIYYVDFPFDDIPGKSKKRPAVIILSIDKEDDTIKVLKVTGSEHRSSRKYTVSLKESHEAGLEKQSVVECDKVAIIKKSKIYPTHNRQDGYIGRLSKNDLENVKATFISYVKSLNNTADKFKEHSQEQQIIYPQQNRGR